MSRDKAEAKFEVNADVVVETNSQRLRVTARGHEIRVEVPDLATGLKLLQAGSPRGSSFRGVKNLALLLERIRLTLTLCIEQTPLVQLGHGVNVPLLAPIGLNRLRAPDAAKLGRASDRLSTRRT